LPQQLTEAEVEQAISTAISETGAASIKDMGRVVAALKGNYAGRMDFGKVSALVKEKLSGVAGGS
jgi:uncharacterized protein YqeY